MRRGVDFTIRIGRSTIKLKVEGERKARRGEGGVFLPSSPAVENPNHPGSTNPPTPAAAAHLATLPMIPVDTYGCVGIPGPLRMLMRSMMPVTSAAYHMHLEDYRLRTALASRRASTTTEEDVEEGGEEVEEEGEMEEEVTGRLDVSFVEAEVDVNERYELLDGGDA